MIENLQAFAQGFPEWLQWLAIALIAMIPFVESYTGTFIGVAIGLHPIAAATAAIAGNAAMVVVLVLLADRVRRRIRTVDPESPEERPGRLRRLFERFGVPGVAFLGHPTQISSAAMVGLGVPRRKVLAWELASITAYGVLIAIAAGLGLEALHA